MAAGDIAILRAVGRFQNQNVVNTFHYEQDTQTTADVDVWTALAETFDAQVVPSILARSSDAYEYVGTKVFTARGDPRPPGFESSGSSGDVVGDPQEAFVCRTLTLYTVNPNPRVRGRVMLSGGVESMFDDNDGSVTTTEIAALATLIGDLLGGLANGGDTWNLVLYNKTLDVISSINAITARVTPSVVRSRRIRQFLIG